MDQKIIIERVLIDLVCGLKRPVNSFTDLSLILVVYGENAFWVAGEFFTAIPRLATEIIGNKAEQPRHIQVLLYIHGRNNQQGVTFFSPVSQLALLNLPVSHFRWFPSRKVQELTDISRGISASVITADRVTDQVMKICHWSPQPLPIFAVSNEKPSSIS